MKQGKKVHRKAKSLLFILAHLACIAVLWVPFSAGLLALFAGVTLIRMFGITAGYHRYFAHRTYKTSRAFQLVLAILGATAMQKGPLWWAAHHRDHHRFSDQPGDPHSPRLSGFFFAHMGWILATDSDATKWSRVTDLARFPELRWLNEHYLVPGVTLAVGLFLVGGAEALVWGFFVSTVVTWHATFSINSLTHLFGARRYATEDDSRNSFWLALATLGEGWHNNHHHYMSSTRQGFFWWEIDISYYLLRLLSAVGLIWDIREPPLEALTRGLADTPSDSMASSQTTASRMPTDPAA